MSRVVDPGQVFVGRAARGPLTNWARYCDGQAHELKRGEDWDDDVPVASKRSSFRQWAKRNGLNTARVHTTVTDEDTMVIYVEGGAQDVPGLNVPEAPEDEPRRVAGLTAESGDSSECRVKPLTESRPKRKSSVVRGGLGVTAGDDS